MAIQGKTGTHSLAICLMVMLILGTSLQVFAEQPAELFKAKCAMCHGADGAGKTPMGAKMSIPDLRTVQKQPAATLEQAITKGKNKMPPWDGKLTKDQVSQLATYIQQLK